ncbi:MAG: methylmalonyl Co-A mutase-associated GTPase MeaB [Chloroflexota bacterium]
MNILAQSVLAGDRLSLARLLTQIENDSAAGREALDALFSFTGHAHLIGVTGAPGTGKSSLVNQLALTFRKQEKKVAIIAVDPSSPFTGGAVLGDRVRMRDLSGDPGVFIRSMATRGSLGGLAQSTAGMTQLFDAAGYDYVIIETVGAGQSEVDIAKLAHTTLVVEAPGLGDDIQAIKAGILEIADILVINKADHAGVENTERALKSMLELAHPQAKNFQHHGTIFEVSVPSASQDIFPGANSFWQTPIFKTVAIQGSGLDDLVKAIIDHAKYLQISGDWSIRDKTRILSEFEYLTQKILMERLISVVTSKEIDKMISMIQKREISPREAVNIITGKVMV